MEGVVAVALAGNILQFLQLALSIVSKSKAYKRSADGSLKEHKSLQIIITDLNESLARLHSDQDDGLRLLVDRCREAGTELSNTLKKVAGTTTHRQLFSSYRQALRAQWSEKAIEEQRMRFEMLRNEVAMHTQVSTRYSAQAQTR